MNFKLLSGIFLLIACSTFSCQDNLVKVYNENDFELNIVSGDNQQGFFNSYLANEIVLQITHPEGNNPENYKIYRRPENGEASDSLFETSNNGIVNYNWRLGCGDNQSTTFFLYGKECDLFQIEAGSCVPYDSINVLATAMQGTGWVKGCGIEAIQVGDSKFVETNDRQYLLVSGTIYESLDEGLNWEAMSTSFSEELFKAIAVDALDNLRGILINNYELKYSSSNENWLSIKSPGLTDLNSEIGGYIATAEGSFLSLGSEGIYFGDNFWVPASNSLGNFSSFKKLIWHENKVFGIIESQIFDNTYNHEFIFNINSNFTNWGKDFLSSISVNGKFQDMISLPNGRIAVSSFGTIAEIDPDNLGAFTYDGDDSAIFKNLNYYNNKLYFLSVNPITNQNQIFRGLNGAFEDTNFPFECGVIFFHIRKDGTYIVGCEDGFYVYNP